MSEALGKQESFSFVKGLTEKQHKFLLNHYLLEDFDEKEEFITATKQVLQQISIPVTPENIDALQKYYEECNTISLQQIVESVKSFIRSVVKKIGE